MHKGRRTVRSQLTLTWLPDSYVLLVDEDNSGGAGHLNLFESNDDEEVMLVRETGDTASPRYATSIREDGTSPECEPIRLSPHLRIRQAARQLCGTL